MRFASQSIGEALPDRPKTLITRFSPLILRC